MFDFKRAKAAHLRLGRRGEAIARAALEEAKMDFLCGNYRCQYGELDLLFRENGVLCVVEVKTRHRIDGFSAAEAVTHKKRLNIIRSTACYLKEIGRPSLPVRYDIVEVVFEKTHLVQVIHHRNAFDEGELERIH